MLNSNLLSFYRKRSDVSSPPRFEGSFTVDGELFTVKSRSAYEATRRNVDAEVDESVGETLLIRESDREFVSHMETKDKCGSDHLDQTREHYAPDGFTSSPSGFFSVLKKRADPSCPSKTKILYMGVAADCTYVQNYGGEEKALAQIVNNWNQASKIYLDSFNVLLGISRVYLQSSCGNGISWNQPCSSKYSITDRLSDFSR